MKNSQIKGPKFLNDKERERFKRTKEADEFEKEMAEFREKHVEWLNRRGNEPGLRIQDVINGE